MGRIWDQSGARIRPPTVCCDVLYCCGHTNHQARLRVAEDTVALAEKVGRAARVSSYEAFIGPDIGPAFLANVLRVLGQGPNFT